MLRLFIQLVVSLKLIALSLPTLAGQATVAVASNFKATLLELQSGFEASHSHRLKVVSAASGVLHQQIRSGAPFDVFLSADAERPAQLAAAGHGIEASLFTYALGRLALVGKDAQIHPELSIADNLTNSPGKLALANPLHAPYGRAAEEVLSHTDLASEAQPRLVTGANVLQAYQFVSHGGASQGLVALSLVYQSASPLPYLVVPESWHHPIEQRALLLVRGQNNPAALAFVDYLASPGAKSIIQSKGYSIPAEGGNG